MNKAYLLTGGNLGNRNRKLDLALQLIADHCGQIRAFSSRYETAAWGKTEQPPFLNQALEIETKLSPLRLLGKILRIEKKMGRIRNEKYGPRIIDIDILFFNELIFESDTLTIPHPEIQNRRFVLVPLVEIAPALIHPTLKKTTNDLLIACTDPLDVTRAQPSD